MTFKITQRGENDRRPCAAPGRSELLTLSSAEVQALSSCQPKTSDLLLRIYCWSFDRSVWLKSEKWRRSLRINQHKTSYNVSDISISQVV